MQSVVMIAFLFTSLSAWSWEQYADSLCRDPAYRCIKTTRHDSWVSLFPKENERDMVRRINRMNGFIRAGMHIAVPKHLSQLTLVDVAPFPRYITPIGEKIIHVNQSKLAWAAYNEKGELLFWGPISSGISRCYDAKNGCETPSGSFRFLRKQGFDCISKTFPQQPNGHRGGARMPFCMYFFQGFALHGSFDLPGYPASHGCIRLLMEDAQWLNESFIEIPHQDVKGTRISIDSTLIS